MDGYISCSNNSRLFGGNGRVTGLLVQAVIATMAEQAKKITPLTEKENFTNWKIRGEGRYGAAHAAWLRANLRENEAPGNPHQRTLSRGDGDVRSEDEGDAGEVGSMDKSHLCIVIWDILDWQPCSQPTNKTSKGYLSWSKSKQTRISQCNCCTVRLNPGEESAVSSVFYLSSTSKWAKNKEIVTSAASPAPLHRTWTHPGACWSFYLPIVLPSSY